MNQEASIYIPESTLDGYRGMTEKQLLARASSITLAIDWMRENRHQGHVPRCLLDNQILDGRRQLALIYQVLHETTREVKPPKHRKWLSVASWAFLILGSLLLYFRSYGLAFTTASLISMCVSFAFALAIVITGRTEHG